MTHFVPFRKTVRTCCNNRGDVFIGEPIGAHVSKEFFDVTSQKDLVVPHSSPILGWRLIR